MGLTKDKGSVNETAHPWAMDITCLRLIKNEEISGAVFD